VTSLAPLFILRYSLRAVLQLAEVNRFDQRLRRQGVGVRQRTNTDSCSGRIHLFAQRFDVDRVDQAVGCRKHEPLGVISVPPSSRSAERLPSVDVRIPRPSRSRELWQRAAEEEKG
jgi:hypothetical protein